MSNADQAIIDSIRDQAEALRCQAARFRLRADVLDTIANLSYDIRQATADELCEAGPCRECVAYDGEGCLFVVLDEAIKKYMKHWAGSDGVPPAVLKGVE